MTQDSLAIAKKSMGICQIAFVKRQNYSKAMKKLSDFAQRLKRLMDDRNMTRADLATATNIPYHRLNPWFTREKSKPNAADVQTVAEYFKVPDVYLLHGKFPDSKETELADMLKRARDLTDDGFVKLKDFLSYLEAEARKPAPDSKDS